MDPKILELLGQAEQRQKSFSDMLKERRKFVGDTQNKAFNTVQTQMKDGVNGTAINPLDALGEFLGWRSDNERQLTQMSGQENEMLNSLIQMTQGIKDSDRDYNLKRQELGMRQQDSQRSRDLSERELALKEAQSGVSYDSSNQTYTSPPTNDVYSSYADQVAKGVLKLHQVPAEDRSKVVLEMKKRGIDPVANQLQKERKQIEGILSAAKSYYSNDTEDVGDDLSGGRLGGILNWIGATTGFNPRAKAYDQYTTGITSTLKGLVGESGVLTDVDIDRIKGLLPRTNSTKDEAMKAWDGINKILDAKYGAKQEGSSKSSGGYKIEEIK